MYRSHDVKVKAREIVCLYLDVRSQANIEAQKGSRDTVQLRLKLKKPGDEYFMFAEGLNGDLAARRVFDREIRSDAERRGLDGIAVLDLLKSSYDELEYDRRHDTSDKGTIAEQVAGVTKRLREVRAETYDDRVNATVEEGRLSSDFESAAEKRLAEFFGE